MSKVTPRPWRVETQGEAVFVIDKHEDVLFAIDHTKANAAHIVKCVNMHEELVRALRDAYDLNFAEDGPTLKEIEALLAKAESDE